MLETCRVLNILMCRRGRISVNDRSREGICDDELESGEDSLFEFDEARLCVEAEREVVPGRGLAMLTNLVNGFGMSDWGDPSCGVMARDLRSSTMLTRGSWPG